MIIECFRLICEILVKYAHEDYSTALLCSLYSLLSLHRLPWVFFALHDLPCLVPVPSLVDAAWCIFSSNAITLPSWSTWNFPVVFPLLMSATWLPMNRNYAGSFASLWLLANSSNLKKFLLSVGVRVAFMKMFFIFLSPHSFRSFLIIRSLYCWKVSSLNNRWIGSQYHLTLPWNAGKFIETLYFAPGFTIM